MADLIPCLLALALLHQLDLVAALFGPARIHARQHFGPVLRLGAARAGIDFQIRVVGVRFAGQQALDLAALGFLGGLAQRRQSLGHHGRIVVGLRHGDQFERVAHVLFERLHPLDRASDLVALAHQRLRRGGVIPQIGVLGAVVQLREALDGDIPVKDASSAAPRTA